MSGGNVRGSRMTSVPEERGILDGREKEKSSGHISGRRISHG